MRQYWNNRFHKNKNLFNDRIKREIALFDLRYLKNLTTSFFFIDTLVSNKAVVRLLRNFGPNTLRLIPLEIQVQLRNFWNRDDVTQAVY